MVIMNYLQTYFFRIIADNRLRNNMASDLRTIMLHHFEPAPRDDMLRALSERS